MKKRACFLAVLVVLAACAQRSPAEILTAAPAAAKSKGSAAVSMVSAAKITVGGQVVTTKSTADGVMDLVDRRGQLHLIVTGSPIQMQPCDMVSDGGILYLAIAPSRQTSDGKKWTKIDVAKLSGIDVNSFNSDPTSQLDYLKSASNDVQTVGKEDVRGTPTTHYRFTVSTEKLLAKLPASTRERLKAAFTQLGLTTLPIDAWVDDDGLPRRVMTSFKSTKQDANIDITTTVETYDYGKPVNVTIPQAAVVREDANPGLGFVDCFGIAVPGR